MNGRTFAAQVSKEVREFEMAVVAIVQQSTQEVVALIKQPKSAGGHMPIDLAFLQNSLQGSYAGVPTINPEAKGGAPVAANAMQIEAIIADFELGKTMHFGFTAVYALRQNYGFTGVDSLGRYYNQASNLFVEHALIQWDNIVRKNERRFNAGLVFGGAPE